MTKRLIQVKNKKRHKMKIIGNLILALCLQVAFASIDLNSKVDRTVIGIDETVAFTIELKSDSNVNFPQFNLPALADFNIVGSSRSYSQKNINGKVDNILSVRFELEPKRLGQLVIPSLTMKIKNQDLSSQQVIITVQKSNGNAQSSGLNSNQTVYPDVFVEASTDKTEYYLGEPIVYTVRFYTRTSFFNGPSLKEATVSNLKKAANLKSSDSNYSKVLGGKQYSVTEISSVYFAEKSGDSVFGKTGVVYSFSPFERNKQVVSSEILVKINSIPENKQFNYAIGEFSISSSIDKANVQVNDGVYLHIEISGYGNMRESVLNKMDFGHDLEQFDPKISFMDQMTQKGLFSKKIIEILLIPRSDGQFMIPKISFTYFNPISKSFVTATSNSLKLFVAKSKVSSLSSNIPYNNAIQIDVHQENADIKYIKTNIGRIYNVKGQLPKIMIVLIVFSLLIWSLLGRVLFATLLKLFVSRPDRLFFKRIKGVQKNTESFYSNIYDALLEYIAGRKKIRTGDINKTNLFDIIRSNGEILETIKYFEERKYMPMKESTKDEIEIDYKKALTCYKAIKKDVK